MPVSIEPFGPGHRAAVRAFNRRLAAGGIGWRFPEEPVPDWLPPEPGSTVYQEYFLLLDGDAVRGAYILKQRDASFRGEIRRVGTLELPLSEGTIDKAWSLVGYQLLSDALRRQPLLFGVGLGGEEARITRVLRAMRWRITPVPFHFKVLEGTRFLRHLRYLRTSRLRSWLMDLAAGSGMGSAGARVAQLVFTRRPSPEGESRQVAEFDEWADRLWEAARDRYSFAPARDRDALNRIYPADNRHLTRLRIATGGRDIGWAVVESRQMTGNQYFGDLRVGTLIDAFGLPEHAALVIWEAVRTLAAMGADVVVSNQSHPAWSAALREAGCLPGPTNFFFATAPPLTRLLDAADPRGLELHVTRGEGPAPSGTQLRVAVPHHPPLRVDDAMFPAFPPLPPRRL